MWLACGLSGRRESLSTTQHHFCRLCWDFLRRLSVVFTSCWQWCTGTSGAPVFPHPGFPHLLHLPSPRVHQDLPLGPGQSSMSPLSAGLSKHRTMSSHNFRVLEFFLYVLVTSCLYHTYLLLVSK